MVVNIPTHIRGLREVSKLLKESGRYFPIFIYNTSEIYSHAMAIGGVQDDLAYVWNDNNFKLAGVSSDAGDKQPPAAVAVSVPVDSDSSRLLNSINKVRRGFLKVAYRSIANTIPGFPTSEQIMRSYIATMDVPGRCVRAGSTYLFTRVLLPSLLLASALTRSEVQMRNGLAQRLLLNIFMKQWRSRENMPKTWLGMRLANLWGDFHGSRLLQGVHQRNYYEAVINLIEQLNPALVVLPEENLFYNHHLFVRAAHASNIACCVVPFTIVNTLEWAEAFYSVSSFNANHRVNVIFAKAFPNWILHHRGKNLILPSPHILGCEALNIVPDNPWLINSGRIDVIAVESRFMLNYYVRAGIAESKLRLTGALSDDQLYHAVQHKDCFRRTQEISRNVVFKRRKILLALPPDQFVGKTLNGCEFSDYESLIKFIVRTTVTAAGSDASVLVNLHPRTSSESVSYLADMEVVVLDEAIETLVPLADIYIAVASATIRLAVSCGIPVINYDAYAYNYDDYNNLGGVIEVKTKTAFSTAVETLSNDETEFTRASAAQITAASELCELDGQAASRMLALFDELTSVH